MLAQATRKFTQVAPLRVSEPNATVTEGAPGHFGPVPPQVGEESKLDACFCMRLQQSAHLFCRTERTTDLCDYVGVRLGTAGRSEQLPITSLSRGTPGKSMRLARFA